MKILSQDSRFRLYVNQGLSEYETKWPITGTQLSRAG
jgi:hypothetical protein